MILIYICMKDERITYRSANQRLTVLFPSRPKCLLWGFQHGRYASCRKILKTNAYCKLYKMAYN